MSGIDYDAKQRSNSKIGSSDGKVSGTDASEQHAKSKFDSKTLTVPEQHHTNYMYNKTVSFLQSVEGKTIKITALYIDIVNSSNKVKKLSNEEAGAYYQTFIEDTSDLIQEYGGYVLKNVGDCVMGFFPASEYERQDKAILCGLALRDTIKNSLNAYFTARGLPSIACRITADFGSVQVVRIRSNGDYSAIDVFGSPMNSAAKIQRYAKPDQIVIGSNLFWKLSHDNFDFKLLNQWDLIGKETYEVYLVDRKNHKKRGDNN